MIAPPPPLFGCWLVQATPTPPLHTHTLIRCPFWDASIGLLHPYVCAQGVYGESRHILSPPSVRCVPLRGSGPVLSFPMHLPPVKSLSPWSPLALADSPGFLRGGWCFVCGRDSPNFVIFPCAFVACPPPGASECAAFYCVSMTAAVTALRCLPSPSLVRCCGRADRVPGRGPRARHGGCFQAVRWFCWRESPPIPHHPCACSRRHKCRCLYASAWTRAWVWGPGPWRWVGLGPSHLVPPSPWPWQEFSLERGLGACASRPLPSQTFVSQQHGCHLLPRALFSVCCDAAGCPLLGWAGFVCRGGSCQ